jgi:hypothetical protein
VRLVGFEPTTSRQGRALYPLSYNRGAVDEATPVTLRPWVITPVLGFQGRLYALPHLSSSFLRTFCAGISIRAMASRINRSGLSPM